MLDHLPQRRLAFLGGSLLAAFLPVLGATGAADHSASPEALWHKLEPFAQPPPEFAGKFGSYRSPLRFADDSLVKTPADWARRRAEILKTWQQRLGPWPPLLERPALEKLGKVERDGYTEYRVRVQAAPQGQWVDGYLLVPKGPGPFPAVLVPFYEPLTGIGRSPNGRGIGTHDYGLQLVKRGFVTLSIGTPGSREERGGDTRAALTKLGEDLRRQPLTILAYVAANCLTALAQLPEVLPQRIGIIGLSYGGKWAMFASCLDERFACAVWSDPGIVFNEKDANVNYWEPWYLGYDPQVRRQPGIPSAANPRTGLYKELIDAGEDLVTLHALMAPRPVLVSGGVQDPPGNWQALNHLVAVNQLLGYKDRVFLTARKTHVPTAPALELELAFLEYHLRRAPEKKPAKTEVSIRGEQFLVGGTPTYPGRVWNGKKVEGLLLNARMVQAIFDDRNPQTVGRWAYPDSQRWDAERNTREFIAALPTWRRHGLLAVTLNLQGGSPEGYSRNQPWHNSAFEADGRLRPDYLGRLRRVLDRADDLGMVVILGLYYFGQAHRLKDEAAVIAGVDNAVTWVLHSGYRNVLIEIDNECDVKAYSHAILQPARVHELIERVKQTRHAGRRLLAGTSYAGGRVPGENVVRASDFLLIHGNGQDTPAKIVALIRKTRAVPGYRPMPVLINEDDHYDFDQRENNFTAAVGEYVSWGFFDYRRPGEGLREGYQSPPVLWDQMSPRKQGFFSLLQKITGG